MAYRIPAGDPDLTQCIWSVCWLIHRGIASLAYEGSLVFLNFFLNIIILFLRSHPVLDFGDGSVEKVLSEQVWGLWLRSAKWKSLNAPSLTPDKWGKVKSSSVNRWRMYLSLCVHTCIHVRLHMWVCECVYMHKCMHVCECACVILCVYVSVWVHVCVLSYVWACVCACVCMCMWVFMSMYVGLVCI